MEREVVWPKVGVKSCPKCGQGTMVVRVNRGTGEIFVGCSRYPTCKWTRKTAYGLDYSGHSCPIPLDAEKCARTLYGVELLQLRTGNPLVRPVHTAVTLRQSFYANDDPDGEDEDETDDPKGVIA